MTQTERLLRQKHLFERRIVSAFYSRSDTTRATLAQRMSVQVKRAGCGIERATCSRVRDIFVQLIGTSAL